MTYTGMTGRAVSVRLSEHNNGRGGRTTSRMRPLRVFAYVSGIPSEAEALRIERAVKKTTVSAKSRPGTSHAERKLESLVKVLRKPECARLNLTLFSATSRVPELPSNVTLSPE